MKLLTQKLTAARDRIDLCRQQLRDKEKIDDGELEALYQILGDVAEEIQSILTNLSMGNYNKEERE